MRLLKARVQNYRAIVDSEEVEIQDRVTVLIGKNEQGKTTFLKALASSNANVTYGPADLPNHLRAELEQRKKSEIPIVTLWLDPEQADNTELVRLFKDISEAREFKVTKYYDGSRRFSMITQKGIEERLKFSSPNLQPQFDKFRTLANALNEKLIAHGERLGDFKPHLPQAQGQITQFLQAKFDDYGQIENIVRTFATGLNAIPGQDAAVQQDIATTTKDFEIIHTEIRQLLQNDPQKAFEQLIPLFIFHSTSVDKIPNEVNINDFVKNPDGTSKGMANLCRIAGLTTQKIQELANTTDNATRETYEDHFKGNVSGGINEYWTQEVYQIHFRFEKDKMLVSISDSTYSPRIPPLDRSDGFQWYLSFYAALLSEVSKAQPVVFVLDNPGLELHADGQRDIKRVLEEKLPANAQVIYVTHSSAMIDPFKLDQVRCVDLKADRVGTKVSKLAFKSGDDLDLLEPVRSAIGASIATSLIMNDFNVLVEGAADKPVLEGAFVRLHKDRARKILINGSLSESPDGFLVRFFDRAKLPFVVYVDADSAGRKIASDLKRQGIDSEKVLPLNKIMSLADGKDFELEDFISNELYHKAVEDTYPGLPAALPENISSKRTKHYEMTFKETHNIGFSKRRVADHLKRMLIDGRSDESTDKNLSIITSALLEALDKQVRNTNPKDIGRSQKKVDPIPEQKPVKPPEDAK